VGGIAPAEGARSQGTRAPVEQAQQRAGLRDASLSIGLLLSAVLVSPVDAGEGAFFADQDGPVIIDRGTPIASSLKNAARPVPQSQALTSSLAQIANLSVELSSSTPCGSRSAQRLVVCLDVDGRFAPADELALLARLPQATAVEAGSVQVREAVIAAAARADLRSPIEPIVTAFADCTGACAGRVVVESAQ
jgi:hypothetical protein